MNAPPPLPPLSRTLRRLIAEGAAVRTMTPDRRDQLWRDFVHHVDRPRGPRWGTAWALVAAAGLILLGWGVRRASGSRAAAVAARDTLASVPTSTVPPRPQARIVHLGSRADLELRSDAEVTLPPGRDANQRGHYRVRLEHGQLSATVGHRDADEPLTVETPQLAVVVVGTRFSVEIVGDLTAVAVQEGRVRVERGERTVLLSAGEAIRSDDPRLNQPRSVLGCSGATTLDDRRTCLRRAADGQGLAAENALFALGLLERDQGPAPARATAHFREYQRRFPSGALAPEVTLALTAALAAAGDHAQACAEAEAFARRVPLDAKTLERLMRSCAPTPHGLRGAGSERRR